MNRNDTINRTLNEMRIAIGEMPVIYKPVDERELPRGDRLDSGAQEIYNVTTRGNYGRQE